ncbi:MAG: recF [Hyphomicrobiales bacterium]|nr:recF [Hyphomicrobiales bacterium]
MSDPEGSLTAPIAFVAVRRLMLADFRSYPRLDLALEAARMVALTGENGAGKTNVLEALSLLTPGRGLRRADLADCARIGGAGGFAISVEIEDQKGTVQLGTGLDPQDAPATRRFRIDRAPVSSVRAFADHVRVVWLTPAMDGLFTGAPGDRRRFVDRLVLAVDAEHGARVNALERALRNRNRLLEDRAPDASWLDAAEREVAEIGVAVTAARRETLDRLCALIALTRDEASPFPWADLSIRGELDSIVAGQPALAAEDAYRRLLRESRQRDAAAGRTLVGPQASDLVVRHGPKGMEAALSSTGEQKALLVGLVLAHARLVRSMSGIAPLVLLDEIAAHFDPRRRAALFASLAELGGQVWMTGADPQAFADIAGQAAMLHVSPGRIVRA